MNRVHGMLRLSATQISLLLSPQIRVGHITSNGVKSSWKHANNQPFRHHAHSPRANCTYSDTRKMRGCAKRVFMRCKYSCPKHLTDITGYLILNTWKISQDIKLRKSRRNEMAEQTKLEQAYQEW